MPLSLETLLAQRQLAEFCRGGEDRPVTGAPRERAAVYRGLIRNIFEDALRRAYPVTLSALGARWRDLVDTFMSEYPSESPELWRMPGGLCRWARENAAGERFGLPWLEDMLLFEWIEIEVYMMPDCAASEAADGNPARDCPVLNPELRLITLEYPVYRLGVAELEAARGAYFLAVYRDPETLNVRFAELSPLLALCIELLSQEESGRLSGFELLGQAAGLLGLESGDALIMDGAKCLDDLIKDRVMLGYRKGKSSHAKPVR